MGPSRNNFRRVRARSFRRTWLILPIDVVYILFSTYISFELRFNFQVVQSYHKSLWVFMYILTFVYIATFLLFRLYTRVWRYAGVPDMEAIVLANTCAAIIVKAIDITLPDVNLPLSVWLSGYLLTMTLSGGTRLMWRVYAHRVLPLQSGSRGSAERILIYGAGSAGSVVVREIQRDRSRPSQVVGFIDDDPAKWGLMLNGSRILGGRRDLPWIIQKHGIQQILVAIPSMNRAELRDLIDELNKYKISIYIIPPFSRWMVDNLWAHAKPVDVEDLLGRDPLPVNVERVGGYIAGSSVLVTGAGGSIGSEICQQVAPLKPSELILLGRGENSIFEIMQELQESFPDLPIRFVIGDVRDARKMEAVMLHYKPTVVFHAAAHKHVPLMEQHPDEAFLNNVVATQRLAELARKYRVARFIFISSDKAVRPTNVMGSTKRIAEMAVQDVADNPGCTSFVTVRFGNVLGSRGSVVRIFRRQIAKGGPVTVTDPRMMRYFMTIPEAVRLVIEAGAVGKNGHVYLLDMGEPVRIADLAERMVRLSGFEPGVDIPIEFTGVRPGEKLFEELSRESDSASIDAFGRIWSVKCPVMPHEDFVTAMDTLYDLYSANDLESLADQIKRLAWWEPGREIWEDIEFVGQPVPANGAVESVINALQESAASVEKVVHRGMRAVKEIAPQAEG